eukprot:CAMPEP_0197532984 /NCGR_PEP_ID=MMETSP1318-20131121/41764_1 /TAXON_ID=552666 /ORGANISM="Partenskyella glossopodia, Strain RCC365" /LENGTH=139 /DNA_ID=CAMNT_0043089717 /DNA_START=136 /DNA_END=555 /DNA_ORIENTATION=+
MPAEQQKRIVDRFQILKPDARCISQYESMFPILLATESAIALVLDSTQRWPTVSVFQRAVVDASSALLVSIVCLIYLLGRASATHIFAEDLKKISSRGILESGSTSQVKIEKNTGASSGSGMRLQETIREEEGWDAKES